MVHCLVGYVAWHRSAIIPGMSDDHQRPDTMRPDMPDPDSTLSLQEAAARAGANERTLRRWIKSGRLPAVKDDGQYRIVVADLEHASRATPGAIRTPDTSRPGARAPGPDIADTPESGHRAPDMSAPDIVPGFDLTPMVSLIERQARELAEYGEAAAVWQERARTLEQRLLQLTAGESEPENAPEAGESPQTSDPAPTGVLAWWKRFWRHLEGA